MHYSAVNTKVRSVYAKYLKDSPQIKLLDEKNLTDTVKAVENWWGIDLGGGFNLYEINRALELEIYKELKSFSYFLQGETKAFYNALMARYEIRDIKRALRVLVHGEDIVSMKKSLLSLPKSYLDSTDGPVTVKNFLQKLESTDYGRQLITYVDQPMDRILFYTEMTLDRSYYENIMKHSLKLSRKDRDLCEQSIGHHIDLLNLMYIYRGKRSYKILPQEMMNFLIEGGQSLSMKALRQLTFEDSIEGLVKSIRETRFAPLFPETREMGLIDIKIEQEIYDINMNIYKKSNMDIGKLLALVVLLEYCIRDISAILEAKRLGFNKDRTRNLLSVRQKEGES